MLNSISTFIKNFIRKVFLYDRLKFVYDFKIYRKYYLNNPDEFIVLDLPVLSDYATTSAKDLYYYYWFAENLQYYHFTLKEIEKKSYDIILKVLYKSDFGIISLKYDMDTYFKDAIKSSERALIRKAIKFGYTCKLICYDDYYDDILEINTSKKERQGHVMGDDYIKIVKRDRIVKEYNPFIYTFGCFSSDGKLVAYYMFERFTNFIHVNKGIGHSDHLNMGIMNYLFAFSVCELSHLHNGLSMVYGCYSPESSNGLNKFKKHVGCKRKTLIYKGEAQQFKILTRFIHEFILHGDSGLNFVRDYIEIHE